MAFRPLEGIAGRLSRRRTLKGATLATAGLAVASRLGLGATGAEATTEGGGLPGTGRATNALEFVGRLEQHGFDFAYLGFVSHVRRIPPELLFANGDATDHQPGHARLLLVAELTGVARSTLDTLFVVTARGTARFFYAPDGGADFDDPETFSSGEEVASAALQVQNVIDVTGPREGRATGWGSMLIARTTGFTIDDRRFRLSHSPRHLRLDFTGSGELIDPDEPHAIISLAGNASVAG